MSLLQTLLDNGVKGTLLIAAEGINGTVSGSRAGIDGLLTWLKRDQIGVVQRQQTAKAKARVRPVLMPIVVSRSRPTSPSR